MYDTSKRRRRDFMAAFRQALLKWNEATPPRVEDIILKIISGGAPHFYVDQERAIRISSAIISGRLVPYNNLRGRMWRDFSERVRLRYEANPLLPFSQVVADVIEQEEAPSFYMTLGSATRFYYRCRKLGLSATSPHRFGRSLF